MTKYHIGISRYIIHSILHLICRCFCFWVNAPFVLKITAIQKICSTKYYDSYYHHYYSTHNVFPLLSFIFIYKKRPCYPISDWITKAEYSVVPLCIIIPVTRYNLLTLSELNSFSCNVETTSRLTIDFSGMLPGDITNYHLPHLTCLRLSVIRFLL